MKPRPNTSVVITAIIGVVFKLVRFSLSRNYGYFNQYDYFIHVVSLDQRNSIWMCPH